MADEALDRPGGRIAQRADSVALDLLGDVEQLIDIRYLRVAFAQPLHHAPHPPGALAARGALAATLMLVEIADAADRADDVGRLVHDDYRRGAEAGTEHLQPVEVHRRVHDLFGRNQRNRRTAGNDGQQVTEIVGVLAATNTAAMTTDQLAEADPHALFDDARRV